MVTKYSEARSQEMGERRASTIRTKVTLWSTWTLFLIGFAIVHWQFDLAAGRPPVIGMVIHTLLAGLIGLIVMTMVEIRLDPERFEDNTPPRRG